MLLKRGGKLCSDCLSFICAMCYHFYLPEVDQGQLQLWTEHSTLIYENLKPVENSKISIKSCIDFQN